MEEILNDMIKTLSSLKKEKKHLYDIYKEYHMDRTDEIKVFEDYITVLDKSEISIDDFKHNPLMRKLYQEMKSLYIQNTEKIQELENYALKLYHLYQTQENKSIPYYDKLEKNKLRELKLTQAKDNISVKEFQVIFGYSKSAQAGFRGRLRNPIPFMQKKTGAKIIYNREKVAKWLKETQ